MKEDFDFKRIGKRMPYTAPDGFLDDIERQVLERLQGEMTPARPQRDHRLWYAITAGLAAACAAGLLLFQSPSSRDEADDFEQLEQAFSQLSSADQSYLLAIYQNDLFINP